MCDYINTIDTNTKFIILMHPKEYRKTKNGTGHFTHKSLRNSKLFIGIDFSNNKEINSIINSSKNECYLLYPHEKAINLNKQDLKTNKNLVLFIIDSTWPCSKKILKTSRNIYSLNKISFDSQKISDFKIKTQPQKYCLSTIETTQYILELLNYQKIENIENISINNFIKPFEKMVEYQISCANTENKPRSKK